MDELVSVVILNFNGKAWIERCLGSVLAQDYAPLEIIVVDNGSVDGSPALIREKYKEALLVETGKNLGYAAANNIGIRYAQGDYIVIMNNDTELEPEVHRYDEESHRQRPEVRGLCFQDIPGVRARTYLMRQGLLFFAMGCR